MTKSLSTSKIQMGVLLLIALAASAAVALGSAAPSRAYWVCPPTNGVNRAADYRCKGDSYNGALSYIEKNSDHVAYGVYRSSSYGGGSVTGDEYFSGSSNYFLQQFHCNGGYPNAHNRTNVTIYVNYTLAGSC